MANNTVQGSSTLKDSDKLYAEAMLRIKSRKVTDHETLLQLLSQETFLNRLDSPAEYAKGKRFLRITRLITAMRESDIPGIRETLANLAMQQEFLANETRVELLIWASEILRPPPRHVVKFWDDHCQPEDGFNGLTAMALTRNGTEPAIALLEKKLVDHGFEDEERVWWMRTAILTRRNDLTLLRACQRLLTGSLPEGLRPELVAVLFDYRPVEWHGPDDGYPPPNAETAGKEANQFLLAIGEYALSSVKLDESLRKIVQARVELLKRSEGKKGGTPK